MMSERVSELRRRLAERLPKSRTFSGSTIPMPGAALSVDFQIPALIRNLSKGAITELVAEKKSSGSALFISALLRQAAEMNQIVALVDGLDSFDPTAFSNETLSRLLWVRCKDAAQALKAVDLILRDRNLPLVALDLRINPQKQLRKLSSSIWYRLQRIVETTGARLVVLTPNAMVGSAQIRLNLQSQFDLSALQKSESELLAELRIEISRNRLHVEPTESPKRDSLLLVEFIAMFAVVRIPDFSLQAALRHEPELWLRPVALIDEQEKKAVVLQMTSAARAAGVCAGLTSTQALARCGDTVIKPRSPSQERVVQKILLQTAYCFSPRTEATADGVCTMDLQGLSLFREVNLERVAEWAAKITSALARANLRACIGIAQTPSLALHAARCANPFLFVDKPAQFISALPIANLEPPPEILDILQRWGIHTVGEFTALGKDNIAERLGPEGLELSDRASIDEVRPLDLVTPPEIFSETMEFENEIESLPPLLFILNRFVEQLANRISVSQQVIAELQLRLRLASGDKPEFVLKVPSPTGNKDVLFQILHTRLENVQTDSPIVALELSATPCRIEIHQFGLFESALRDPNQFAETLARLSALCGAENVGTPFVEETHRPDTFRMLRPQFEGVPVPEDLSPTEGLKLRRFRPALRAEVELENGAPAAIRAVKLSGRIARRSGPWRASGDWWEQQRLWNRDEWDVETADGALGRIFFEGNEWFLEGVYD